MKLFRKRESSGQIPLEGGGDLYFGLAVGCFVIAHAELMGLWSRLKADEAASESAQLASGAEELAAVTEEVNASVEETTAAHHEMRGLAGSNQQALDEMERLLKGVANGVTSIVEQMGEVSQRLQRINQVGEQVASIADQTNLLALNATIEAARAGDHGRGFAVVAQEVGKLAGNTIEAVTTVKNLASEMGVLSETVNRSSGEIKDAFDVYSNYVASATESVNESMDRVQAASKALDEISQAVNQVTATTEGINQACQRLAQITSFGSACSANAAQVREAALPVLEPLVCAVEEADPERLLAARLYDHAKLLRNIVEKAGAGDRIPDHTECAFGRWYDGEGGRQFSHLKAWREIDQPHRRVHSSGRSLVSEARPEYAGELAEASLELLRCFVSLKSEIK